MELNNILEYKFLLFLLWFNVLIVVWLLKLVLGVRLKGNKGILWIGDCFCVMDGYYIGIVGFIIMGIKWGVKGNGE